ncbi:hypothetical protein GALL_479250 [mine drainage metagenome]|uniref:Uncharacterized protein n=1 Tax=mine drainage metagenome TaxID=410659 RepID=A0A1J5PRT8_9ZZZZ
MSPVRKSQAPIAEGTSKRSGLPCTSAPKQREIGRWHREDRVLPGVRTDLLQGDVIEEGGRYRGIVHAVHHHGMCASVELIDGTRIALDAGGAISVRA